MKRNRLDKFIAVFFMLFTGADLLNPHICSEEMGGMPFTDAGAFSFDARNMESIWSVSSADSQPEQSPLPARTEEDCFCCCSHILPGSYYNANAALLRIPECNPMNSALPDSPPHELFRPPRLS